jgi:hypothetical protein
MRQTDLVAHSAERISAMLRRGLAPLTDNREALLELGFARAYPQVTKGYDATIWERSVDRPVRQDGLRSLARERAFLVS